MCVTILGILVVSNLDVAGKAFSEQGSTIAAINCYEMMTSIEQILGVRSVRLAKALTELSICYSHQSRLREAMSMQKKAIDVDSKVLGAKNPTVLMLQANLAGYEIKAKKYADAEKILNDVLIEAEQLQPPAPYAVGFILNTIADLYMAQQKYLEAEIVARRLEGIDDILLAGGYYPFYGKETLVEIYARTGRLAEAESEARSALTRSFASRGDRTVAVASYEALGKTLILEGKKEDAQHQFDRAMKLLLEKYGACEKTDYWKARYAHLLEQKNPFEDNG